ncbi:phosphatase PAP2 family protein [Stenotrophomonas sp. LGBM10]|uniref:phosphatase PAP2 family protein n=1 Tax=Stenotrophomonas sp. LGBM10 TaxID=3390038 RepID=UPI00398AE661
MFQTHWHVWLQSFFDAAWMMPLMTFVTALGYEWAYVLLIVVCSFGVRLRAGLGMLLAVLLMSMVTHAIKQGAALPRPSDVDIHVLDKGRADQGLVADGAAPTFWSLPSDEAIASLRAQPDPDYGFISGHVGVATAAMAALVLGMGIRSRRWRIALLVGWPLLMALSRMYLGRHFLADVMGGWLVGMMLAWFAWYCLPAPHATPHDRQRLSILGALGVAVTTAALTTDLVPADSAGRLLGLVLVFGVLHWRGWPLDPRTAWQRIGRVLAVTALYLAIGPLLDAIAVGLALPDVALVDVVFNALGSAAVFMGGIALAGRWPLADRTAPVNASAG